MFSISSNRSIVIATVYSLVQKFAILINSEISFAVVLRTGPRNIGLGCSCINALVGRNHTADVASFRLFVAKSARFLVYHFKAGSIFVLLAVSSNRSS
jgi:hypothetical protein